MKKYLHNVFAFLSVFCLSAALSVQAQTRVFDPADPVKAYDSANPPAKPASGQVGKWVRTARVSWNTSGYKCYAYNYNNNNASTIIAFRLKFPKNYDSTKQYPVILFLHGKGEYGTVYDNEYQLYHGGAVHASAVDNGKFDGFILYPQSTSENWSSAFLAGVSSLIENVMVPRKMVDPFRVYVNGLSAGGWSTWTFLRRYTKLVAAITPISAAETFFSDSVTKYRFTPIYHFQGGLDTDPDPTTSRALGKKILAVGGNYTYKEFADRGHDCWYQAWADADYFPFYNRAHKANPWPLYGRTEFCQGVAFNDTLGVTPGFDDYEWRKNGVLISGANSNMLVVSDYGTYDCRILKGSTWSVWSPQPVIISVKVPTVQPMIMVSNAGTNIIPAPDGSTTVPLQVPNGYASYNWQKEGSTTVLSTTRTFTASTAGNYKVKVTEQYGCAATTTPSGTTARIQAEDYAAMSGVQPETTPDVGGGQNIGAISLNDWMDYKLTVPSTGTYNVKLRLGTPKTGAQFKIKKADGTVLATVSVPNTTSYNIYRDVTTTINLVAGSQIIRFQSSASSGWNFNWFDLTDPGNTITDGFSMRFPVVNAGGSGAPNAVTNLEASAISKTAIQLSWSQTASPTFNETGFEVYVASASGGPYTYLTTTVADATGITFNNLASGTTFYYKVRAVNNNGASATAGPASATTLVDNVAPTTPPNLRLGTITKYSVALLWDGATDDVGVKQYDIYINGAKAYVVSGSTKSTTVYNLLPDTDYTFAVKARDAARNTSSFSNSVAAHTLTGTLKQDPGMLPANPANYSLYINLNVDNPAPAPWVNTNKLPVQGLAFKNLKNYAGYASGANLTIVNNFSGYNPGGMITGNNSGVYPDNVMRSMYYCDKGVVAKLQVSGLSLKHKYSFVFFGSRNGDGDRTSVYKIGTHSVSLNASLNTTKTVQLDNIVPDENGTVTIEVALGATAMYAYLNSLVIKAYPVTTTTITRTPTYTITPDTTTSTQQVQAFPNPAQDHVFLTAQLTQPVPELSVNITDATGSLLSTQRFTNVPQGTWRQRIPFTNRAAEQGVYFISLTGLPNGKSQVLKVMKVR